MRKCQHRDWILAVAWVAVSVPAGAATLTGKGELGAAFASGNTETENANAKLELATEVEQWKHSFGAAGIYASDDVGTTAQRWEIYGQSDYKFNPRDFWFGAWRYEDDRFSGFDYQAILSTGVGRKFVDTDRTKFQASAGVGYKFFETKDVLDDVGNVVEPGVSDSEIVLRGNAGFEHSLTATTKILDKFLIEAGSENTFLQNDIALQVKMTEVLALSVGYSVRHNTDPPTGFDKTDTLATVNLVYEIK